MYMYNNCIWTHLMGNKMTYLIKQPTIHIIVNLTLYKKIVNKLLFLCTSISFENVASSKWNPSNYKIIQGSWQKSVASWRVLKYIVLLRLTVCILIDAKGSPSLYLCNQLQHLNGKKIIIIILWMQLLQLQKGSLKKYILFSNEVQEWCPHQL